MGLPRKLTPAQVKGIAAMRRDHHTTLPALAMLFGVSQRTIIRILRNETYKEVPRWVPDTSIKQT